MIYDCFTFYNELELLEIRLNVLNSVVDKFVLIEGARTYTNQPKLLYYQKNKARYKKFNNKIIHVVVRDSPRVSHAWIIEHFLMAATIRGLKKAKKDDIILISNLDEIPRPEKILEWKDKPGRLKVFEQQLFYYFLNFAAKNKKWQGTKMIHYKNFIKYMDAYVIRHSANDDVIKDGGWHFSYVGGIERIRDKILTGSHQEFNNPKYNTPEKILATILSGRDLFNRGERFERKPYSILPQYIQENQDKYKDILLDPEKSFSPVMKIPVFFLDNIRFMRNLTRSLLVKLKLRD